MRLAHTRGLRALTLPRPERPAVVPADDYVTFQHAAGWSKYKQWQSRRWAEVIASLDAIAPVVQIDQSMCHSLSASIAMFANASMHIGIDSFCNHLTNYYWTDKHGGRRVPGVILWGSTQASAAGYPHNTNISLGLPCQPCFRENPAISRHPRGPCTSVVAGKTDHATFYEGAKSYDDPRPHGCMDGISVEQVVEAVRAMWQTVAPKVEA